MLLERVLVREREEPFMADGVSEEEGTMAYQISRMTECLKHAFADRARWLGDPAYVDVPVDWLLSDDRLDDLAARIEPGEPWPPETYGSTGPPPDDAGTSHFNVVDQWGGAVACTETINTQFGSLVGVDQFGFVLNNEMDDFTTRPGEPNVYGLIQSDRNAPAPGKRPLSSMSPTIVLDRQGDVFALAGASGGPRIISGTMQALYWAIAREDWPGDVAAWTVGMPRFHHQWLPDFLRLEDTWWDVRLSGDVPEDMQGTNVAERALIAPLRDMGYAVGRIDAVGNVQLIVRAPGGWHAASDPRKGGRASGH